DLSSNSPTSWSWSFPGGTPSSSTLQSPIVQYNTAGTYSVTLTSTNAAGSDQEAKTNYIIVEPLLMAPAADFTANMTVITAGESVTFSDLSTNDPTNWTWSFQGGIPNFSTLQNPTILYPNPGTFNVSLTAANTAGNNIESKMGYIIVEAAAMAPMADFTADETMIMPGQSIAFTDLSTNEPTTWDWSFPGGVPNASDLQNPIVLYPSDGVYDVSLTASNQAGSNTTSQENYVSVGVNTSINRGEVLSGFQLFPNPVFTGNIQATFNLAERTLLDFYLVDATGRVIRHLLHDRVKRGENQLSFSTDYLPNGTYFLVIQTIDHKQLYSEKFIVARQ
ncbi:MAG: PKD domain-containing protein, partial [Bacteroidota bacterium]